MGHSSGQTKTGHAKTAIRVEHAWNGAWPAGENVKTDGEKSGRVVHREAPQGEDAAMSPTTQLRNASRRGVRFAIRSEGAGDAGWASAD